MVFSAGTIGRGGGRTAEQDSVIWSQVVRKVQWAGVDSAGPLSMQQPVSPLDRCVKTHYMAAVQEG